MTRRLFALCLLPLLGACDGDPSEPDPCSQAPACQVSGVDLAIEEIDVAWTADQPIEPNLSRHFVQPGDQIVLVARIVNRGDETSDPADILLESHDANRNGFPDEGRFAVAALRPGEAYDAQVVVDAPTYMRFLENEMVYTLSLVDAGGDYNSLGDAEPLNDRLASEHVLVALPRLEMTVESPDEAQVAAPFGADVVIRNRSPFPSGAMTLGFCLRDFDLGCSSDFPGFSLVQVPSIDAFGTAFLDPTVTIDPESSYSDGPGSWNFLACALPAGSALSDLHNGAIRGCASGGRITVLPE